jgi:hypothetical protein
MRIAVRFSFQKYLIFSIIVRLLTTKISNFEKKSGFTIVEQAIVLVPYFEKVVRRLEQQVTLRGQSTSTLKNYIRRIALFVVHFGKLPEHIDPEEINEYLVSLARDPKSPSRSSFKHMVYGLRYYYRLLGMNKSAIALPSLKGDTKLPETGLQRFERLSGVNPYTCPLCKSGRMVAIRELPRIRAPDCLFPVQFPVLNY